MIDQATKNDLLNAAETILGYRSGLKVTFSPAAPWATGRDRVVSITLDNGDGGWDLKVPEHVWVDVLTYVAKNGVS